jgi:hypothetical protein
MNAGQKIITKTLAAMAFPPPTRTLLPRAIKLSPRFRLLFARYFGYQSI